MVSASRPNIEVESDLDEDGICNIAAWVTVNPASLYPPKSPPSGPWKISCHGVWETTVLQIRGVYVSLHLLHYASLCFSVSFYLSQFSACLSFFGFIFNATQNARSCDLDCVFPDNAYIEGFCNVTREKTPKKQKENDKSIFN